MRRKCLLIALGSVLLAGCATSKAEYCDVAGEIKLSRHDVLTDESARQIDREQEKFSQFCGKTK